MYSINGITKLFNLIILIIRSYLEWQSCRKVISAAHLYFSVPNVVVLSLQSVEASKRSSLNSRFEKLELSLKKKGEEELERTKQQKEKLDKKLEIHNEKREAYLNEIKSKLKDHVSKVWAMMVHGERIAFIVYKIIIENLAWLAMFTYM